MQPLHSSPELAASESGLFPDCYAGCSEELLPANPRHFHFSHGSKGTGPGDPAPEKAFWQPYHCRSLLRKRGTHYNHTIAKAPQQCGAFLFGIYDMKIFAIFDMKTWLDFKLIFICPDRYNH